MVYILIGISHNCGFLVTALSALIPNTDLKDGSCSFVVSYGSSTILFFAISICSMLHLSDEKQKTNAKHKQKMLNTFCIVYVNIWCGSGFAGATSFVQEIEK